MASLDFSKLVHQPDTFTDEIGVVHQVRSSADMGAVDLAKVNRLKAKFDMALKTLGETSTDVEAAADVESAINGIIAVILPSVPAERIAVWTLGQKSAIAQWWTAQENERQGKVSAKSATSGLPSRG